MPQINISNCRGVNATRAALQLEAGESSLLQNIRSRPTQNLVKRKGIESTDAQAGAVWFIGDFNFDSGEVVPLRQDGATLTFNAPTVSPSLPAGVTNPVEDTLDDGSPGPGGSGGTTTQSGSFPIEQAMRALSCRALATGVTEPTWPSRYYNLDGSSKASYQSPGSYPPNGFYGADLYWADINGYSNSGITVAASSPRGTFVAALVNFLRTELSDTLCGKYVNENVTVEGATLITYYSTATIGRPAAATASSYVTVFNDLRICLRKLYWATVDATQTGNMQKTGTYTGAAGAGYQISNMASLTWTDSGMAPFVPSDGSAYATWDGKMDADSSGTLTLWQSSSATKRKIYIGASPWFAGGNCFLFENPANFYGGGLSINAGLDQCTLAIALDGLDPGTGATSLTVWSATKAGAATPAGTYSGGSGTVYPDADPIVAALPGSETCTQVKDKAKTNFDADGYSSTTDDIGSQEYTNDTCTASLTNTYARLTADMSSYKNFGYVYMKLTAQTNGASNWPSGYTADKYHFIESAKCGGTYTSSTVLGEQNNINFTGSSTCPAGAATYGWKFSDAKVVASPKFAYNC